MEYILNTHAEWYQIWWISVIFFALTGVSIFAGIIASEKSKAMCVLVSIFGTIVGIVWVFSTYASLDFNDKTNTSADNMATRHFGLTSVDDSLKGLDTIYSDNNGKLFNQCFTTHREIRNDKTAVKLFCTAKDTKSNVQMPVR